MRSRRTDFIPLLFFFCFLAGKPANADALGPGPLSYQRSLGKEDFAGALELVLEQIRASSEDRRHFHLTKGLYRKTGGRAAQTDPETLEVYVDPGLFINETYGGACQMLAHELAHLRHLARDRRRLRRHFEIARSPSAGWAGCDRDEPASRDAGAMEARAYGCLEDNDLIAHDAAYEIEGVLSQLPYAPDARLRPEDYDYLNGYVKSWIAHPRAFQSRDDEQYYLPEMKREDLKIFCRGLRYVRKAGETYHPEWDTLCRNR